MIMNNCWNFTLWFNSLKNPEIKHYAFGSVIAQNFFIRERAVEEKNGVFCPDFSKLFICIDELSHILEYHMALGTYDGAKAFVKDYSSPKIFKRFLPKIKKAVKNK